MRRIVDALMGLVGLAMVLAAMAGWVGIVQALRPVPADGRRYEPPASIGATVVTRHGRGVITAQVMYGDGPRWQVRLENGRHVVLNRAEMVVQSAP